MAANMTYATDPIIVILREAAARGRALRLARTCQNKETRSAEVLADGADRASDVSAPAKAGVEHHKDHTS